MGSANRIGIIIVKRWLNKCLRDRDYIRDVGQKYLFILFGGTKALPLAFRNTCTPSSNFHGFWNTVWKLSQVLQTGNFTLKYVRFRFALWTCLFIPLILYKLEL